MIGSLSAVASRMPVKPEIIFIGVAIKDLNALTQNHFVSQYFSNRTFVICQRRLGGFTRTSGAGSA